MLVALIISFGLYELLRISDREREPEAVTTPQVSPVADSLIGIQPARFQQISEYMEEGTPKLRLSGDGEVGTLIVLTNRGEKLHQVEVNELGQWGVTLDVEDSPMVLEAQLYRDENAVGIRSEKTIFRLPVPTGDDVAAANYTTNALIMMTAPGNPSRIIQSPFGGVPTSGPISLSVIDYDSAGGIIITGTSSLPGRVRIYAEDSVIGDVGIGVSGRWSYIAGRMLPRGEVEIRAELIPAPGLPNTPEGPLSLSVPFKFLPVMRENETDGSGALSVIFEPLQWQIRRTLIGGGGQSTIIFSPDITK